MLAILALISGTTWLSGPPCSPTAKGLDQTGTYEFAGRSRKFIVHLPPNYDGQRSFPLVICLHGGTANIEAAERDFKLNDTADKHGFIVAYPNGTGTLGTRVLTWNAGPCCGYAYRQKVDDVGFLRSFTAWMQHAYKVNRRRTYMVGFSLGGTMAYQMVETTPGLFAAIGVVSGWMTMRHMHPARSVPILMVHGTTDKSVPIEGGDGKWAKWNIHTGALPLADTVHFWTTIDGCAPLPVVTKDHEITRSIYTNPTSGEQVVVYVLDGFGHEWPGGKKTWLFAPQPDSSFPVNEAIWKFLSAYELNT